MFSVGNPIGKTLAAPGNLSNPRPKVNRKNIALRRSLVVKMSAQGRNMSMMTLMAPQITVNFTTPQQTNYLFDTIYLQEIQVRPQKTVTLSSHFNILKMAASRNRPS
jgi:hypothetical protein